MYKLGKLLLVVIAFAMLYVIFGCGGTSSYPPPKSGYTVKYEVRGDGCYRASLTYSNAQGGTEQYDVKLPFSKSYLMKLGDFAYVSAQNDNDRGKITCRIYVDGVEWKKSTSSGAYVIASCSGLVGRE